MSCCVKNLGINPVYPTTSRKSNKDSILSLNWGRDSSKIQYKMTNIHFIIK